MKYLQSTAEMIELRLIRSVFTINADFSLTEERVAIGVSIKNNGEFLDDGQRAHFVQSLKIGDPTLTPFFLDVEFSVFFALSPAPLPLERSHYINRVFPQLVFPYLREYVAETTRRGGFSPLIINPPLFNEDEETENAPHPQTLPLKFLH